jgi:hypothetical protein
VPFRPISHAMAAIVFVLSFGGCARQVKVTSPITAADGTLRVTNNLAEPVEVFAKTGSSDTFLRRVGPHVSESFRVPGYAPGAALHLSARTQRGTMFDSQDALELGSGTCPESHVKQTLNRGCEWTLP